MTDDLKRCSCCGCTMLLLYFSKNRKGEYLKTCMKCRERFKKRNARPEIKIQRQKYREEHKEERHIYDTQIRDKEKKREADKEYYNRPENRERAKQRTRDWRKNNPEKAKENKELYKPRRNQRARDKRATDPSHKIRVNLGSRICKAVKHGHKSAKTMDLIGCTIEELKQHLQGKFEDGMTFDNYGEWHIDHITPCIAFNLLDPEEQRKCFNWENLQPLWAKDNMSKGGKLDWNKK